MSIKIHQLEKSNTIIVIYILSSIQAYAFTIIMKHTCLLNIVTLAILEICLLNSNLITLVTHEKYTHHIVTLLPYSNKKHSLI